MGNYLQAEISASAIRSNVALLRRLIGSSVKLCAVVKADCYGHGLSTILPVIAPLADCLAVATPEEALNLRRLGYGGAVLMFFIPGACLEVDRSCDQVEELINQKITLTVTSKRELELISKSADRVGKKADVHVKIDTGMSRSGVSAGLANELLLSAHDSNGVRLEGAYTHLATADEKDNSYVVKQLECFASIIDALGTPKGLVLHAANSAAVIDLPDSHLDMVRTGIAVYGYQPSGQMHNKLPLKPILRLTGRLMQIKTVPPGSKCGYGLTYTFRRDSRIGLVPCGYADGYPLELSNKAVMSVHGRTAGICGRISMDQVILDLTDIPQARVGDEVEIISNDPRAPNSVENLAALAGSIPYEISCRLGGRASRILVD